MYYTRHELSPSYSIALSTEALSGQVASLLSVYTSVAYPLPKCLRQFLERELFRSQNSFSWVLVLVVACQILRVSWTLSVSVKRVGMP